MRVALLIGATGLLSACAVPPRAQHASDGTVVPTDAARLVVFRTGGNLQYLLRSAALTFDASDVGGIAPGERRSFDVQPGKHTFAVAMWDVPGRCELTIQVEGGGQYFYEVAPRIANMAAILPAGMMPTTTLPGLVLSGAAMLGGLAIESAGKRCGGAYSITQVEPSVAVPKLTGLRTFNHPPDAAASP